MRALVWHGKEDVRCDTVTDPEIEDPRDAIVKVTSCAICGSDLHLFHNFIPANSDRSGWPRGLENSRGAAADFDKPGDMRAAPAAANASQVTGRTSPATEEFSRSLETAE